MKSFRISALSGLALSFCVFMAACGGSGSKPPAPPATLAITSTVLPQGALNTAYSFTLQGNGGSGTFTWSVSSGSLPPGLTLNSMTALISGIPTAAGTFNFTAKVADGVGDVAMANLSIAVEGAILVTCNSPCVGNALPAGNPGVPYTPVTLAASGGQAPYSWCIVESNGSCDNGAGGGLPLGLTMSPAGVIMGTPTTPGTPTTFTAQATDSETIPSRGSAQFTITILGIGTTSLPDGIANTSYSQTMVALGGIPPYSWTLTSGSLPPGLHLDPVSCTHARTSVCKILGIPTQTGAFPFTVQAQDGETPPATVSASLSITIDPRITNSNLMGNFAFSLNGFTDSRPYVMAGAFISDGNGNITGGFLDLNDGSGESIDSSTHRVIPQTIGAGSVYSLGASGLGTLTLATNVGTYQFSIVLSSATACVPSPFLATCGRIIQSDPANPRTYGSGALKVQYAGSFVVGKFFPGNFALQFSGSDPNGNRYVGAGSLGTNSITLVDIDCSSSHGGNGWGLDGCPSDVNNGGAAAYNPIKGTFSSTVDGTTGRGDFVNMSFPTDPQGICVGGASSPACNYAYYIVNQQEMIIISADPITKPANLTLWSVVRQTSSVTGWSLASLHNISVVELNAANANGGSPLADVSAGLLSADGAGNATFNSDENDGGTLNLQQTSTGTYAIDASGVKTGKITFGGFSTQFGTTPPIIYLFSPDDAFVVGTDANASSGFLEPQVGSPYSNASVSGAYGGGTIWPVTGGITNSATALFADGAGNINTVQDTSGPAGPGTENLTLTYQVTSTGRTVVNQLMNRQPVLYGVLYVISPTKVIMVPVGRDPALNIFTGGPDL